MNAEVEKVDRQLRLGEVVKRQVELSIDGAVMSFNLLGSVVASGAEVRFTSCERIVDDSEATEDEYLTAEALLQDLLHKDLPVEDADICGR